ncbi:MAG TPA: siderophore-interacting protein [Marmoricola sp.]|nr:siderophore-interacting protein [Nocardioidaceae bacterium]HRV68877.1 siderophore-interacting protein [Marmoricola sp.]
MNARAQHRAVVVDKTMLDEHLVRLTLRPSPGLETTGVLDEWVGLVVPGQYQSRYYTIRSLQDTLVIDVVIHEEGLVTSWASGPCQGDEVGLTDPKGSFAPAPETRWVVLAGDLTALPAMARIAEECELEVKIHAEAPKPIEGYFPDYADVTWHQCAPGESDLAQIVAGVEWQPSPGYFWMAGESAQMRELRRFARHTMGWSSAEYDVMGYWSEARGTARRSPGRHGRGPND